jgi:hypothetical protein
MNTAAPPPRSAQPANHPTPMADLEVFLTSRLLSPVDTLAASGWRAIRAGWRQASDGEVRVRMTTSRLQMPASLAGGCVCVRGHPLQDLGGADRSRPLPLRPLPAAIGQRLLDRHHHQTLDNRDRRRNRGLRRYRFQRPPCCAPILPALRFSTLRRSMRSSSGTKRKSPTA